MAIRKAFPTTTIKIIWGASGAICAFPSCGQSLIIEDTGADHSIPLGEMAHIIGHSDSDGPRKDPSYPREKIDLPENIILLCPTHHTLIDKQDTTYTVEDVRGMKRVHEAKVQARLEKQVLEVKSQDFEQLLHFLVNVHPGLPSAALPPTPPEEKMRRNDLTDAIRGWLNIGLAASHRVEDYIKHMAVIDSKYPERLRDAFRKEHDRLRGQGFHGDSLFLALLEWMEKGRIGTPEGAAVYPVMAHLFQTCELFEP
jgi:hypothetical protein